MDNQSSNNRIEHELDQWQAKEERLSKLFSKSNSFDKALHIEKLKFYEGITAKFGSTKNIDEQLTLRVIKQQRNAIERLLYPNFWLRVLRRIFIRPVKHQLSIVENKRALAFNSQSLHEQVQRAGFANLGIQLERKINEGQQQFSIPVSYYINEKERLEHTLSFGKNASGQYQLEGFKSSLYNELKPNEDRQQYFKLRPDFQISATEAYNLLSGRSIQKDGNWKQLDLTDRDAQGNYRIKEFPQGFGYDLEKVVNQLPIKQISDRTQADLIINALMQGHRQAVSFLKDGKEQWYYIEANPQFKSINIYDEHSRKITLATATGSKTTEPLQVANKVNEKETESQSKRVGMRVI